MDNALTDAAHTDLVNTEIRAARIERDRAERLATAALERGDLAGWRDAADLAYHAATALEDLVAYADEKGCGPSLAAA